MFRRHHTAFGRVSPIPGQTQVGNPERQQAFRGLFESFLALAAFWLICMMFDLTVKYVGLVACITILRLMIQHIYVLPVVVLAPYFVSYSLSYL